MWYTSFAISTGTMGPTIHTDNYTDELDLEVISNIREITLTNLSDMSAYVNSTEHVPPSYTDNWSYNFWPLIVMIMPVVTVGGNLLVIVSIRLNAIFYMCYC